MAVILIGGQAGVGKTTLAKKICYQGDALLLSTDTIKSFCRVVFDNKWVDCDSHSAWQILGGKNKANIVKGFKRHARVFEDIILGVIAENRGAYKHIVVEGVHITPSLYEKVGGEKYAYYIDLPERKKHWRMFDLKNDFRTQRNNLWYDHYDIIVTINDFMVKECQKHDFKILNDKNRFRAKQKILNYLT